MYLISMGTHSSPRCQDLPQLLRIWMDPKILGYLRYFLFNEERDLSIRAHAGQAQKEKCVLQRSKTKLRAIQYAA